MYKDRTTCMDKDTVQLQKFELHLNGHKHKLIAYILYCIQNRNETSCNSHEYRLVSIHNVLQSGPVYVFNFQLQS